MNKPVVNYNMTTESFDLNDSHNIFIKRITPKDNNPARINLIIGHGLFGSHKYSMPLVDYLYKQLGMPINCIMYDLVGHGSSSGPRLDWSENEQLICLKQIIKRNRDFLEDNQTILIGIDLSGLIFLGHALESKQANFSYIIVNPLLNTELLSSGIKNKLLLELSENMEGVRVDCSHLKKLWFASKTSKTVFFKDPLIKWNLSAKAMNSIEKMVNDVYQNGYYIKSKLDFFFSKTELLDEMMKEQLFLTLKNSDVSYQELPLKGHHIFFDAGRKRLFDDIKEIIKTYK